jgi:hypothetical protein
MVASAWDAISAGAMATALLVVGEGGVFVDPGAAGAALSAHDTSMANPSAEHLYFFRERVMRCLALIEAILSLPNYGAEE